MTFTNIDNALLQGKTAFTKPAQKLTYMYLTSFLNCEKVFPSIDKIAIATCQSERNAMRVIQELEGLGFIKVERTVGKSNIYTLIPYDQATPVEVVTPDKVSPTPVTKSHPTPVTKSHTKTNTLLKTKVKNNISITRESVIGDLMNEFPNVPVQEIANNLESDGSVDIKTVNQFKGLLTYRVKNWKPQQPKTPNRKITRTEMLPEWFGKEYVKPVYTPEQERELAERKAHINEMLKELGIQRKEA